MWKLGSVVDCRYLGIGFGVGMSVVEPHTFHQLLRGGGGEGGRGGGREGEGETWSNNLLRWIYMGMYRCISLRFCGISTNNLSVNTVT